MAQALSLRRAALSFETSLRSASTHQLKPSTRVLPCASLPQRLSKLNIQLGLLRQQSNISIRNASPNPYNRGLGSHCAARPSPYKPFSVQCAASEGAQSSSSMDPESGGLLSRGIALGSVSAALALFIFTRLAGAETPLALLAAEATPYDEAMLDTRPAMVEFYADWCEVCKEMARDVSKVEDRYRGKVNFVMINVDDTRFTEELDEFGVDGIPHFVFLDKDKNEQGFVVGRLPRRILSENLNALANGEPAIPHAQLVGTFSDPSEQPTAPSLAVESSQEATLQAAPVLESSGGEVAANLSANVDMMTPGNSRLLVASAPDAQPAESLFDFEVENIKGDLVSLGQYEGKVSLVVNVASKCGLTDSNYKGLTQLYSKYKDQGLEILGFPCNQFLGQEPGSNEQIENFACSRYKATYPLFSKIDVNGPNTAPLYKFLKAQQGNGSDISWNFEKFLVDKSGKVVHRYAPTVSPLSIEDDLRALL